MRCPPGHLRSRVPSQSRRQAQIESGFQGFETYRPAGRQYNRGVRLTRVGEALGQFPYGIVADGSQLISARLALVANSLCLEQEERTMRETEVQIGNSGLIAKPWLTLDDVLKANERYHPAGLIFSTLGAILVLYICYKLNIHFPQI